MKPLLDSISSELSRSIYGVSQKREYGESELIFDERDEAKFLPIVISGRVKMAHVFETGKELIIGIFNDNEMFAVPPVFDGVAYPASAYAMTPTVLLLMDRARFLDMLRSSDEFAFRVIGWMCDMLRDKTATIQNLARSSPEHRVGNVLMKLAEMQIDGSPIKIPVRRQDVAEMASLTTETTIRVTKRLADRGIIRIVRGKIVIDDLEPLRQFLGD